MAEKVKSAADVMAADVWVGKSNAERKQWLKQARCPDHLDTVTFEDLPLDVQEALELAK
jgi:hypothetical protein